MDADAEKLKSNISGRILFLSMARLLQLPLDAAEELFAIFW